MHAITARLKHLFLSSWHPFAWFFIVGFLVWGQTLFFGFSYFDDNVLILDRVHQLRDVSYLKDLFQDDVFHLVHHPGSYYRPLLVLSFMADAFMAEANPFIFHCSNVLIHIMVVCLFFILLSKMFANKGRAFCLSLLFLVHPATAQTVAWLPGRNDSLLALFAILSFLFFLEDLKQERVRSLMGHLVCFLFALFTKESAVALPILCFLYFAMIHKGKVSRFPIKFYIGWSLCLALWFVCRSAALQTSGLGLSMSLGSFFLNSPSILLYAGKIFFPFNLSVFPVLRDAWLGWGILVSVILLSIIFFLKGEHRRMALFGSLWFLSFISFALLRPTSLQAPADFLEHRLYIPMMGVVFLLMAVNTFKNKGGRTKVVGVLFIGIFGLFTLINISYTKSFSDRMAFWRSAVNSAPHAALAHANLGAMYYLDQKFEPAVYAYQQALELNPHQEMVRGNLALIFEKQGRLKDAEREFLAEIALNPRYADGYFNLGLLRYRQKQVFEARQLMREAVRLDSGHVGARKALAVDYYRSGDQEKLGQCLNELRRMNIVLEEDFLLGVNLW